MSRHLDARHLNIQALADAGQPLTGATPLQKMERLAPESVDPQADTVVNWIIAAESRPGAGGQGDLWLHIQADVVLALTCQRCMSFSSTPVAVNQWYRFVADEDVAMAEDDASEEDLLVMTPQFDALHVLEDELLMALPLVPMHEVCPVQPTFTAGEGDMADAAPEKPNPFAALAKLKKV
jgi:uncharacterized protein